ncbi:MAG: hypothetical protein M3P46_07335 [Actinomycetota bacterium]|nr:hypothetical protein [Actinomycetota bacterium]
MGRLRLSVVPWWVAALVAVAAAAVVVTRLARGDATPGWGLALVAVLAAARAWQGLDEQRSRRSRRR